MSAAKRSVESTLTNVNGSQPVSTRDESTPAVLVVLLSVEYLLIRVIA